MIRFPTISLAVVAGCAAFAIMAPAANAADAGAPVMPLIIEGDQGAAAEMTLDSEALAQIRPTMFETETPWTEGVTRFEGVSLQDLLAHYGIEAETVEATALNDYSVTLPAADENGFDPLIAYKVDGEVISVRNKGPFWIVYPFDKDSRLSSEKYYSRSIWQLVRLTAR